MSSSLASRLRGAARHGGARLRRASKVTPVHRAAPAAPREPAQRSDSGAQAPTFELLGMRRRGYLFFERRLALGDPRLHAVVQHVTSGTGRAALAHDSWRESVPAVAAMVRGAAGPAVQHPAQVQCATLGPRLWVTLATRLCTRRGCARAVGDRHQRPADPTRTRRTCSPATNPRSPQHTCGSCAPYV